MIFATHKGPEGRWRLISSIAKVKNQLFEKYNTQKPWKLKNIDERSERRILVYEWMLGFARKWGSWCNGGYIMT